MSFSLPPALVLTAGLGTRLAPLTDVRAKPAVPVAGTPLIMRVLSWLGTQGVGSAVLNLHHKPETITRCVGHGTESGITVRYSWEPTILGTAGGPRRAVPLLGQRFFIINGDTLTDVDLRAMTAAHEASAAEVTLAVTANPAPHRYGGAVVDRDGWVQRFAGPGRDAGAHFVGVQLVEASVFAALTDGEPAASIGGVYDTLAADHPHAVKAHWVSTAFHDVGTPADYLATSLAIAESEGRSALPLGERNDVHPTATLTRTAVWDDVVIGAGCRLVECVVADAVRLPQNGVYKRQMIVVAGQRPPANGRRLGHLWICPLESPSHANRHASPTTR